MKHKKNVAYEFDFLRSKLEKVGVLLMRNDHGQYLAEIAFMLGCLHNICAENANFFQEDDE